MKNQVFVSIPMIRFLPLLLLVPTASFACSLPLDGSPANCPDTFGDIKLPRTEVKGEVDIYDPYHWNTLHGVYVDNLRKSRIEQTATKPSDAINSALAEYNYGSNDTTEQEELLQLQSHGD